MKRDVEEAIKLLAKPPKEDCIPWPFYHNGGLVFELSWLVASAWVRAGKIRQVDAWKAAAFMMGGLDDSEILEEIGIKS